MSRVKEYSTEELSGMPLSFIRNLDVQTVEEEIILQAVVNEKLRSSPIENIPQLTIEEQKQLDSPMLTPEKEREIQVKLDARRAKYRAVVSGEIIPSLEVLEEEPAQEEPVPEVPPEATPEVAKFCEFCTSKGGRHLKICTR